MTDMHGHAGHDSREKLNEDVRNWCAMMRMEPYQLDFIFGWLDRQAAITEREYMERSGISELQSKVDELQAQLDAYDQTHMPLPVDADGVPIRVGDVVKFGEYRNQGIVKALNERMVIAMHVDDDYTNYARYGLLWSSDACRHVELRTVEDVLSDGIRRAATESQIVGIEMALCSVVPDVAAEIRGLMGGDDE